MSQHFAATTEILILIVVVSQELIYTLNLYSKSHQYISKSQCLFYCNHNSCVTGSQFSKYLFFCRREIQKPWLNSERNTIMYWHWLPNESHPHMVHLKDVSRSLSNIICFSVSNGPPSISQTLTNMALESCICFAILQFIRIRESALLSTNGELKLQLKQSRSNNLL